MPPDNRTPSPLPREVERSFGMFPRRRCIDELTPLERALYDAIQGIENMPADVRLTRAQMKIDEAREWLADYLEDVTVRTETDPESEALHRRRACAGAGAQDTDDRRSEA